jgi:flagellar basal body-associated protein FliL
MASVAFESHDPATEEQLRSSEVKLRDVVVATLGSHTIEMLSEPATRDSLKARIKRSVSEAFEVPVDFEVFLPQFVVQ